jgi:hypothetical protein
LASSLSLLERELWKLAGCSSLLKLFDLGAEDVELKVDSLETLLQAKLRAP